MSQEHRNQAFELRGKDNISYDFNASLYEIFSSVISFLFFISEFVAMMTNS